MILWRIAAETRKYAADDLSGAGTAKSPGRWNDEGQPALYTAPTIAIAPMPTPAFKAFLRPSFIAAPIR